MVSNNWHLEVTHPAASVFRLYIYDSYSKPFSPPGLAAHIIESRRRRGQATGVNVPFTKTRRGYYEARLPDAALPRRSPRRSGSRPHDKEYRFDFIFLDYSKEPAMRAPVAGAGALRAVCTLTPRAAVIARVKVDPGKV